MSLLCALTFSLLESLSLNDHSLARTLRLRGLRVKRRQRGGRMGGHALPSDASLLVSHYQHVGPGNDVLMAPSESPEAEPTPSVTRFPMPSFTVPLLRSLPNRFFPLYPVSAELIFHDRGFHAISMILSFRP